jgi:hypothetical protein
VHCSRPQVSPLLEGRTCDEALKILGTLYTVCGWAQRAAGELAMDAARGEPTTAARVSGLMDRVLREAAQEHLWRLLLDWRRRFGLPQDTARFREWYRRIDRQEDSATLGRDLTALIETDTGELSAAFAQLPREAEDAAGLDHAAFETGALARHVSHPRIKALLAEDAGLAARVAARVVDLGSIARRLAGHGAPDDSEWFDAATVASGAGRAIVQTARGALLHEARLEGDRILRYRIRVPTDVNFAPDGAFVRHVRDRAAASEPEAARLGGLWALALDPCVPYEVSVGHA